MKRLHVNLAVANLDESVNFYTTLFAAPPTVLKLDYAKWMLDDPRVNFAISARGAKPGLDHFGIQVDDRGELLEVHERLKQAGNSLLDEGETTCCYAKSEKAWVHDPQGTSWETFMTTGESPVYGNDEVKGAVDTSSCCAPAASVSGSSCC